ncbi:decaprenyl-diphosphate synthase subunit 2 isoform X2 [Copidosoma floridanum]|uniref:decaprenyl-diphosphate synthase subunit 2 isoform X2 n=1 Tax=Copidosoma floridanum TaxID=29053 RepID=UPI0006C99F72|nr:decaprenyl-diphosphate synthase subunit 2 isoform X2 [Copidosoma floridanum]XP_023246530.1 decaprenyl-diphosphate synthase subunit 2 isoform X2 [Copidosoma floridanum]XP_023246531.1 decaprenyl-diphosphate synthase subunit 2 isoform X2 [Copidosoma floridanum]XP_023246532.1 decaprenyl-diphosphate synthase subunit 2 isoform X2 [Copidosoma floridanum]
MSSNKQILSLLCNKHRLLYNCNHPMVTTHCNYKKHSTKVTANPKVDWNQAVTEAEKVVGHPTSFLNPRWLLNDEIANVAVHLQKLVGSNHPLITTAKSLFNNENSNMQTWGLIVLLLSKAASQTDQFNAEEDARAGVLHRQKELAEITEMIRIGHLVHRGLVNFCKKNHRLEPAELNDMTFGNKIALLSGDYLLGTSCMKLACIKNHSLLELMSCALKDLSESAFIGRRDSQENPLPAIPPEDRTNYAVNEWTHQNYLGSGSFLAKSCKGTLILAGHDEFMQEQAHEFGKHLALAWQANLDLVPFIAQDRNTPFNLNCAPVMYHIEYDPSILMEIDKGIETVENVNFGNVFDIVIRGPGVELTKELQQKHSQKAIDILTSTFKESEARTALTNIITSIGF